MRKVSIVCLALAVLFGVNCAARAEDRSPQDIISQQIGALYIENTNLKVQLKRMADQLAEFKKKCGKPCDSAFPPLPDKK